MTISEAISKSLSDVGCECWLHVLDLSSGAELGVQPDDIVVMASVAKVPIALEFFAQASRSEIDPDQVVDIAPEAATPGPTGISCFKGAVRISLGDLARQMLTVSDNAATDMILGRVGLDRINARLRDCGCPATTVVSDLKAMLDGVAVEMGFDDYAQLLAAQEGRLGEPARARSVDRQAMDRVSALDPRRASRTTPREMTRLLGAIWRDEAADPAACAELRDVMRQQVTRRLEPALPDGATLAAKSGGLFGRVRNEIGVIGYPDGRSYAAAIFTRAHDPFQRAAAINARMAQAVGSAISALRSQTLESR